MPRIRQVKRATGPSRVEIKTQAILETATELFVKRGYHGTSMDTVSKALGVTKPFLYYYYKDKADILAAICRKGADLTYDLVVETETLPGTPTDRLAFFARSMAGIVMQHGRYLAVYRSEISNLRDEDRRQIRRLRGTIDLKVEALIQSGIDSGEFDVDDVAIAATSITGMLSHIFRWYRPDGPASADKVASVSEALVLRMVGAMPASRTAATARRRAPRARAEVAQA